MFVQASFKTKWEGLRKEDERINGVNHDPKKFGDLDDVDLFDDRVKGLADFEHLMRYYCFNNCSLEHSVKTEIFSIVLDNSVVFGRFQKSELCVL
jgi:hypothetical protein